MERERISRESEVLRKRKERASRPVTEMSHLRTSSSVKKENIKRKKPPPKKSSVDELKPEWITDDDWSDLLEHRKGKKAKNTKRALNAVLSQMKTAISKGFTVSECIDEMVNRNWTGFKAEWMENVSPKPRGQPPPAMTPRQAYMNDLGNALEELEHGTTQPGYDQTRIAQTSQSLPGGGT